MKKDTAATTNEAKSDAPEISDSELEAIMSGTALDALLEEETTETEATDDLLEAAVEAVENDEAKAEAYEEQDKTAAVQPEPDLSAIDLSELVEEEAKKEVKPKRKRRSKKKAPAEKVEPAASEEPEEKVEPEPKAKPKKPAVKKTNTVKVAGTSNMKPSEILRAKLGDDVYKIMIVSADKAEKSDVDDLLEKIDKMPKKVGKKFCSLFCYIAEKGELSVFIKIPLTLLANNGGTMTFEEIKKEYESKPYSLGTASTHASQMQHFLVGAGICTKGKNYTFKLRKDSILWLTMASKLGLTVAQPVEEEIEEAA